MKSAGRARREVLVSLCPPGRAVVDVGADHGHVARAVGGIATERRPGRMGRWPDDVPWVVADGLRPFRQVDVAVVAGMGAVTIAGILERGPRPSMLVLHAQDDPPRLRAWLAADGWRIDAERLAPEAGRYAEVVRAVPGVERATGLELHFGPRLLEGSDPLAVDHFRRLRQWLAGLVQATADHDPAKSADLSEKLSFLEDRARSAPLRR